MCVTVKRSTRLLAFGLVLVQANIHKGIQGAGGEGEWTGVMIYAGMGVLTVLE